MYKRFQQEVNAKLLSENFIEVSHSSKRFVLGKYVFIFKLNWIQS